MVNIATCLFAGDLPPIVGIELSSKEKEKLWVVSLFLLRHLLKLWTVPSHKVCQLVNDVACLHICIGCNKTTVL